MNSVCRTLNGRTIRPVFQAAARASEAVNPVKYKRFHFTFSVIPESHQIDGIISTRQERGHRRIGAHPNQVIVARQHRPVARHIDHAQKSKRFTGIGAELMP